MMPLENLEKYAIVLASKSPRRKQLLTDLGIKFSIVTKDTDESFPVGMQVSSVPEYLAEKKALAFEKEIDGKQLIITADTIVMQDGMILTKPENDKHAKEILQCLSGNKHQVITGVCLFSEKKKVVFSVSTDVWFKKLTSEEIDYYIKNYKPFDKAGAYGIQEWIGYVGIYRIDGSYFNVMGLPVQQVYEQLSKF